jgi:peptidoglycan-associated lipoprotein
MTRFAIIAICLISISCSRKPATQAPAPVVPTLTGGNAPQPPEVKNDDDRDRLERERLERERLAREAAERAEMTRILQATIHFAYDRSDLSEQARSILDDKARVLSSHPEIRIRISGHTDERGSDEYNVALGQQRAAAAHRYLIQRGIAVGRIDFVSVGESRPLCSEVSETCWTENRRAEFEIVQQ